jgi:translation elongation factor EF-Tu-like GTPase
MKYNNINIGTIGSISFSKSLISRHFSNKFPKHSCNDNRPKLKFLGFESNEDEIKKGITIKSRFCDYGSKKYLITSVKHAEEVKKIIIGNNNPLLTWGPSEGMPVNETYINCTKFN